MARPVRKSRVKEVPLSEVKDDLSRYLREAEEEPVVITRHGKPAGVLSASSQRMTGSTTGWRTIRGFWRVSTELGPACGLERAFQ